MNNKEFLLQQWVKDNNIKPIINTTQIPNEYDEDIIDYLMEYSDDIVTDIDTIAKLMFEKLGITDEIIAFIHWVDDDFLEYITYIKK